MKKAILGLFAATGLMTGEPKNAAVMAATNGTVGFTTDAAAVPVGVVKFKVAIATNGPVMRFQWSTNLVDWKTIDVPVGDSNTIVQTNIPALIGVKYLKVERPETNAASK